MVNDYLVLQTQLLCAITDLYKAYGTNNFILCRVQSHYLCNTIGEWFLVRFKVINT